MKIGKLNPYTKASIIVDDIEYPVMIIDSDGEFSASINHPSKEGVSVKLSDTITLRCLHDGIPVEWNITEYSLFKTSISSIKLLTTKDAIKKNNREAFRIVFKQEVSGRVRGNSGVKNVNITIENISRVGLGFTSTEVLERGDFITVKIERNEFSEIFTYMIVRNTIINQEKNIISYGAVLMSEEIKHFMRHLNKWQLEEFKKNKNI